MLDNMRPFDLVRYGLLPSYRQDVGPEVNACLYYDLGFLVGIFSHIQSFLSLLRKEEKLTFNIFSHFVVVPC